MHDIVVVSDLHLGRGLNPKTGRYFRLEAFFYDDDFQSFCRWLCAEATSRKQPFKLILNGDTFDLLRIDQHVVGAETKRERRFGPLMTPANAADTTREILAGHRGFREGVAHVLSEGYPVIFLPGNHDLELQWAPVQTVVRDSIRQVLEETLSRTEAEHADELLEFRPWFYYEPERIWIEHGCQYDKENSFEYFLRGGLAEQDDAVIKAERDVPMGHFFQRYLYNKFGSITFIVPSSRANLRYFRWLLTNKPRLLAKVATSHFPFFLQVIRRIAKSGGSRASLNEVHQHELAVLAAESELRSELPEIDELKAIHGSAAQVARGIIAQTLKIISLALLMTLLVAGVWFAGFQLINHLDAGVPLKAVLFITLNFLFFTTLLGLVGWLLLRPPALSPSKPARLAAARISRKLSVPIVTFGHSHDEVVFRLGDDEESGAWYFNTGTWVAVFTHDELMPRERVQYTFLRVSGGEARLLHWSPGRGEAVPVILLEDDRWGSPERPREAAPT